MRKIHSKVIRQNHALHFEERGRPSPSNGFFHLCLFKVLVMNSNGTKTKSYSPSGLRRQKLLNLLGMDASAFHRVI